jgi:hypothetical protein
VVTTTFAAPERALEVVTTTFAAPERAHKVVTTTFAAPERAHEVVTTTFEVQELWWQVGRDHLVSRSNASTWSRDHHPRRQ